MFYLHSERILAVGCGAPGRITYLDFEEDWYAGVRDFEEQFKISLRLEQLKTVPVLLLIGEDDTEAIDYSNDAAFLEKAGKYGKNRVEGMESLYRNYQEYGLNVRMIKVPGVWHEGMKMIPYAEAFFEEILQKQ